MKYFLIILMILGMGAGYYWWSSSVTSTKSDQDIITTTTFTPTQETEPEKIAKSDYQTYANTEWGISFTYPNDWEIREPAFGGSVSYFNLAIEPNNPYRVKTIVINILQKEWIENAMKKMENDGIIFANDKVYGLDAIRFESAYEGLPQVDYLILVNNTYWINISGKKGYETELNQVLNSFTITPVETTIQN